MKYEQERQRATHLMILLVYTITTIGLIGESLLLRWETGAIVLLIIGLAASWVIHITGRIPESIRIWLYFVLTMLTFFFYGIHETSVYDMAPLMILIILMYSATEMYSIVRLCIVTYFLTMGYDFLFVIGGSVEISALVITRTLLHLALVCMAGKLVEIEIQRRQTEKKITDSKIAELEETNRRTEDFLANVSHELRTPINAVTGITAVMLKNETDAEKRKDIVSVQKAGGRLFNQIEDILDYTEIDTGRIKVGEDTYMITSIVNDIIAGNRLLMRENTRELILDVDAGIPSVLLGDGRKIKKILMHLIDNAIKFTKRGGVYVRVYALHKPYGINLCIRVCDTGIGIAEEDLGKIKERFFQSNGGRNRRAGGLGLGLSIVYGMVTSMEGFMQIESTLGSGTTVSVSIPQKVSEEAPSMVVENRTSLCLACFLRPEKYEVPEVRDYYNEMISHMVQGLDIPLHRAYNIEEMKKLTSVYQLTHLFLGREEYEENKSYFEELAESMEVFAVGDEDFTLPKGSRVRLLRKPFYSFTVASILNAVATEDAGVFREKRMICPNVTVLVVDDEPMNLMVAEEIFKGYQMKVKTAESGREAIDICEREDFDLIFMDHMMPEMDGVETLKQLRKITKDSGRVLTVIALTANAVSGAREMFLQEGFNEFVSKPIETYEMERALRKVLPKSSIAFVDEDDAKNESVEHKGQQNGEEVCAAAETAPENTSGEEDRFSRLESAGIHTKSGLQYCQGDAEFYMELLTKFAQDASHKENEIQKFFVQEDLGNYRILVHALKSTAKMVGAESLSEMARCAEEAAKNDDMSYIRAHQEELLEAYRELVQQIKDILNTGEPVPVSDVQETGTEVSTEELLENLEELSASLGTYEADKAEELISRMSGFLYQGNSVAELLHEVRQDVEEFELAAAQEKVEAIMNSRKGGEA